MSSGLDDINGGGIFCGFVTWILLMFAMSSSSACIDSNSCDGGDLILAAMIGVGMLGPAWIVALLASPLWKK